ncbi:hypothetical protein VP1G_10932 [Cytospora mali]|uniref:Uncharacterized protein n=1 Tax=Cytospora mali TaxID=578113 RepID=A0A194V289_CYTMA|nr:hypothetical protein VP1G_10932 [Valsa mali var. pyri (nom. inval.)]
MTHGDWGEEGLIETPVNGPRVVREPVDEYMSTCRCRESSRAFGLFEVCNGSMLRLLYGPVAGRTRKMPKAKE